MDLSKKNIQLVSIIIFGLAFFAFYVIQPGFLYNLDGSIKQFGIGRSNKTILPVWLLSIILGILSYLFVLYYATRVNQW